MTSSFMQIANKRFLDKSNADGVGFIESFLLEQFPGANELTFEDLSEWIQSARRDHDSYFDSSARVAEALIDCLLSRV